VPPAGDDEQPMMLAILVISLLAPGLAFLIYIVFQALLLGKADDEDSEPADEHDQNAES
jgi:hypothetical protein